MIYLDHNATTPLAPTVAAALRAAIDASLAGALGNPSSQHAAGPPARALIEQARRQVADLLGAAPEEIVFTSGGTEANNLAIKGRYFARRQAGPGHIVSSAIEHAAVTAPCRFLERLGVNVTWLPVDRGGRIDPDDLRRLIRPETFLISLMHANNEVGTLQPIAECAAIARAHGIPLHSDAAQSVGKVPTAVDALGVDLLSLAGHKFQAPAGIGALYVRRGCALEPLLHGAGHEDGRRAGTESVVLAAGLGAAAALAADLAPMAGVAALRERLWAGLQAGLGERVVRHGRAEQALPNTLNCSFIGHQGGTLLAAMPGIAASAGAACAAGQARPSPVLRAMGVPDPLARGSIRFSLGRDTTAAQIDQAIAAILAAAG